ncbi:MAG: alpha/beta hydrolase-fold protein [Polyangiales bacterium]
MPPWATPLAGRLDALSFDSTILRGNPLGDPHVRPLWVYVPPGYDAEPSRRYPSVYMLQGYTGSLDMWRNRSPFRPTFPEAADALFASGGAPPCILVFVDAWTAYGGSQFVDSPGTGNYHTYLCDELVPFVDARYRTMPKAAHRGIAGKSSGGFGAMITPMLRPDLFGGFATHAGDGLYEACYLKGFFDNARTLRDKYDGSYAKFWEDFRARAPMSKPDDGSLVITYGCAACFSAEPDGSVTLPFDPTSGRVIEKVWQRWLDWDPVRMVARYADAMRSMRAIWIDAGKRDEWYLDLAAEAFHRELLAIGVTDARYELFEGTHMAIDYRYPLSLKYLAERLA